MDSKRTEIQERKGAEKTLVPAELSPERNEVRGSGVGSDLSGRRYDEIMRITTLSRCSGMTLLELMFAVAVCAILAILAAGQFGKFIDRSRSGSARADIATMEVEVLRFRSTNGGALPDDLAQIGRANHLDPWKRPYHYTKLAGVPGHGSARKDHKLNPLNTDFDLFSAGKDGVFKPQVSQKDSLDDIIRARDGAFIGVASDF